MSAQAASSAASEGGLDLDLDDAQQAVADAVAAFCRDRCPDERVKELQGEFPAGLWRELGELGILGLAAPDAPEGEGGPVELVAALESLGRAAFPGPLPATFLATQLLTGEERAAVAAGERVVCLAAPPVLPFGPVAEVFLVVEGERAWQGRPAGPVEPAPSLGGEPWGRGSLERVADLGDARRALAMHDLALAAYLAAAAERLVEDTAEHARTRRQFGRPIGEFQAVAHPLADCAIEAAAAGTLARIAAFRCAVEGPAAGRSVAAAARLAAVRAGLRSLHAAHQLHGAVGITVEGPVFHVSRRVRQLASQPPGLEASREAVLHTRGLAGEERS